MNQARRVLTVLAAVNITVMLLVPPCDSLMIGRGSMPTFDAYYPIWDTHPRRFINTDLLFIQISWVMANYLAAFVIATSGRTDGRFQSIAGWALVLANAGLILLFPPFENYSSASRVVASHFEGFYFAFGDRAQRPLFLPLLYLELMVVALNAAVLRLAFGRRRQSS